MIKISLIGLLAVLGCAQAMAAAKVPAYVGKWDCQVSTFIFTDKTYDAGEGPMPIRKVEANGNDFMLYFDNNYSIGLTDVTDQAMSWFSPETGDGFDCTKLPN